MATEMQSGRRRTRIACTEAEGTLTEMPALEKNVPNPKTNRGEQF